MGERVTEQRIELDAGGRRRAMTVVTPALSAGPLPIALVFHGSGQRTAQLRAWTGGAFDRWAVEGRAVVAYLEGHKGNWNDARRSVTFAARRDDVDDVAFARAALDAVATRFGGDSGRVFAVGYSNGGALVLRLAHEIGARLSGIGVIAATQAVPENLLPIDDDARPLTAVLFHGTKDRLVPYEGGMASLWGFRPRGMGTSALDTAAYFATRNGIAAAPTRAALPVTAASRGTRVERTAYAEEGHPAVSLYTVREGGHTIPGPSAWPRIFGRTGGDIAAADVLAAAFGL